MQLNSPAFANGGRIPTKYTGDGDDVSPPLAWDQVPTGTKEFVLVCDDPDAPTPQPWVHWVLYCIPAATRTLSEDVSQSAGIPGVQGKNSWKAGKTIGYRGPAPLPVTVCTIITSGSTRLTPRSRYRRELTKPPF